MRNHCKNTEYPIAIHAVFGDGIVIERRLSDSGNDVCDCLFMAGTAPRTILSGCLLLFAEQRTATLQERRSIKRWLLARSIAKPRANEPDADDFHIADSDQSGTLTDSGLEQEQELTA